jgi:hypothetical protein
MNYESFKQFKSIPTAPAAVCFGFLALNASAPIQPELMPQYA